jgi:AcrR family transcriptional regulator
MDHRNQEQDPRVIRTRKLLREAFIELVIEQGYHKTTIKDITERATLNRVTFYLHFKDKQEFLEKIISGFLQELVAQQQLPQKKEHLLSYQQTHQAAADIFHFVSQHGEFFKAMLVRDGVWEFHNALEQFHYQATLERLAAIRGEVPETKIEIELLLRHLAGAFLGVLKWWLENNQPHSPETMASKIMTIYQAGIYRCLGYQISEEGFSF